MTGQWNCPSEFNWRWLDGIHLRKIREWENIVSKNFQIFFPEFCPFFYTWTDSQRISWKILTVWFDLCMHPPFCWRATTTEMIRRPPWPIWEPSKAVVGPTSAASPFENVTALLLTSTTNYLLPCLLTILSLASVIPNLSSLLSANRTRFFWISLKNFFFQCSLPGSFCFDNWIPTCKLLIGLCYRLTRELYLVQNVTVLLRTPSAIPTGSRVVGRQYFFKSFAKFRVKYWIYNGIESWIGIS